MSQETSVLVQVLPGGAPRPIVINEGDTVGTVLNKAGVSPDGYSIRLDGSQTTDLHAQVRGGSRLILQRQIKGN